MKRNTQYGMKTIGGIDGKRFCISYAGKCIDGWKELYKDVNYKPWKKWFGNPIFHNRSGYDDMLGRYRVWFIFMWHIVNW